jgi:hypothetical protein
MTGDPNKLKLTDSTVPELPTLKSNREYVITQAGFTTAALTRLPERCNFWKAVGSAVPI